MPNRPDGSQQDCRAAVCFTPADSSPRYCFSPPAHETHGNLPSLRDTSLVLLPVIMLITMNGSHLRQLTTPYLCAASDQSKTKNTEKQPIASSVRWSWSPMEPVTKIVRPESATIVINNHRCVCCKHSIYDPHLTTSQIPAVLLQYEDPRPWHVPASLTARQSQGVRVETCRSKQPSQLTGVSWLSPLFVDLFDTIPTCRIYR